MARDYKPGNQVTYKQKDPTGEFNIVQVFEITGVHRYPDEVRYTLRPVHVFMEEADRDEV